MGRKPYSREWLIEKLQRLAARLGHSLTKADVDADPTTPCYRTYANHFGSWNSALEAAGLPLNRWGAVRRDRETLLEMLRQLADQLGRAPTTADLAQRGLPCDVTYAKHFGSWRAALAEIGLQPKVGNTRYQRDELLSILRQLDLELGHSPSQAELGQTGRLPSPSTYKYYFGGWNRALEAAGLTPRHPKGNQKGQATDESNDQ